MPDLLDTILALASVQDAVLTHGDVAGWPAGTLVSFEKVGLLRRCSDAGHVVCDQCSERHTAPVDEQKLPDGSLRHFIVCPEAGRVELDDRQLRQWRIDHDRFAELTAEALGTEGTTESLAPQQMWRLGTVVVDDRQLAVVLIRGIAGTPPPRDTASSSVATEKTVLIEFGQSNGLGSPQLGFAAVLPLTALLRLRAGRLVVNRARIETSIGSSDGAADKPVVDDQNMSVTYRRKTCRFSSRAKNLWALFERLNRRPGQHVLFDKMRQPDDIYGDYRAADASIRRAMTRLRMHLTNAKMGRLSKCLKTGSRNGRSYAVLDLSAYDAK